MMEKGSGQKAEGAPGSAPLLAAGVSSGGAALISQRLTAWGPDPVSRTEWGGTPGTSGRNHGQTLLSVIPRDQDTWRRPGHQGCASQVYSFLVLSLSYTLSPGTLSLYSLLVLSLCPLSSGTVSWYSLSLRTLSRYSLLVLSVLCLLVLSPCTVSLYSLSVLSLLYSLPVFSLPYSLSWYSLSCTLSLCSEEQASFTTWHGS